MAVNASVAFDLPPLPTYTMRPRENLIAAIPDNILSLILPIVAYWGLSMIYHYLDVNDYFVQYRLHTPAEVLKRNKVSRWEVVRDVVLQQIIQTFAGLVFLWFDAEETVGREGYDVAVWAQRLRILQKAIPSLLALVGVDAAGLAKSVAQNGHTMLAGAIAGGSYPGVTQSLVLDTGATAVVPAFTGWELAAAGFIYWYFVPALQFMLAISIVDTWQYFLHRAMHLNRWLYGMFDLATADRFDSDHFSDLPFSSSSSLRSLRLWCSLQPPLRGVSFGYCRNRNRVLSFRNDHSSGDVVLHTIHHQDRR